MNEHSSKPLASHLRTEYLENPLGIDEPTPRFSYLLDHCTLQAERCIEVRNDSGATVWNSGWVSDEASIQIPYQGQPLRSFTRYLWRVKVRDTNGCEGDWNSEEASFETGFMDRPWTGKWIGWRTGVGFRMPVQRILRDFSLRSPVARARLYVTALGLYEAYLNGKPVSHDCFTPGWTDYFKRVQYQAYDVTERLQRGDNTLALHLGEGWYNGRIARHWRNNNPTYGDTNMLRCELHLTLADGSTQTIVSDRRFQYINRDGAIRASDIYDGEIYEAWRDTSWMLPNGCRDSAVPCKEFSNSTPIVWHSGARVRRIMELKPVTIAKQASGAYLVDFGQNLTGREKIRLTDARQGATIVIKHGEMLNPDGALYLENLRTALATTVYSCGTRNEEIYEPHFTFFGFRYLEINGWPGALRKSHISAVVLSSDLERTGEFSSSHPLLNQLYSNVIWGQRGNFLDVPTDCPQRDERFGWTGDAQVFMDTATYNFDGSAFYTKWIADLNSCQQPDGAYPYIAPSPFDGYKSCTGWSDAALICPWIMFWKYADLRLMSTYFDQMKKYLDSQITDDRLITGNAIHGDWLNLDDPTGNEFISTAYLCGMAKLLSRIAAILNRHNESRTLDALAARIQNAFQTEFLDARGMPKERSQTALLLSLHFDLLPEPSTARVVKALVAGIRKHDTHLTTGFLGTPLLLPVLSRYGQTDLAYDLLLQTTYPGWLYPITQGATTMWERWNSYTHKDGFGDVSMNSFNHYAYGAVAEWFYQTIGGIRPDYSSFANAGFKRFILAPQPGHRLTHASVSYRSAHGTIASAWKKRGNRLTWNFSVPCNTAATVVPPYRTVVKHSANLPDRLPDQFEVPAGDYELQMQTPDPDR